MKHILLDTNALIFMLEGSAHLKPHWYELLVDPANRIYYSAISIAEISLKKSLGKLEIPSGYVQDLESRAYLELPFLARHGEQLANLPGHHRDPFDRMIIAQAVCDDLAVMTSDGRFFDYDVTLV